MNKKNFKKDQDRGQDSLGPGKHESATDLKRIAN